MKHSCNCKKVAVMRKMRNYCFLSVCPCVFTRFFYVTLQYNITDVTLSFKVRVYTVLIQIGCFGHA